MASGQAVLIFFGAHHHIDIQKLVGLGEWPLLTMFKLQGAIRYLVCRRNYEGLWKHTIGREMHNPAIR